MSGRTYSSETKPLLSKLTSWIYTDDESDGGSASSSANGGYSSSIAANGASTNSRRTFTTGGSTNRSTSPLSALSSLSASASTSASGSSSASLSTVGLIAVCIAWYLSSALQGNIGKSILSDFRYPVTLTYVQFYFVAIYSVIYGKVLGFARIEPPSREIITKMVPLAAFLIVGHLFNSIAISSAPVSFVHTVKAASPLFTVLIYRVLFGAKYSRQVYLSLVPLTVGVMLACFKTKKDKKDADLVWGSVCALLSCLLYVSQNIFSKRYLFADANSGTPLEASKHRKLDKINVLFYSAIMSIIVMFPLWYFSEGHHLALSAVATSISGFAGVEHPLHLLSMFWLNGTAVFGQSVLAITILASSSAVTYSIASLLKRVFVIVAAFLWFRQPVGLVQGFGVALAFLGLWLYDTAKSDVRRAEKTTVLDKDVLPTGTTIRTL
ncbi:TPT-domain-containing protein [Ramicandelaber brevisporus]|nr:TPT-domain-containing protein [Ramicandelaber brevisporus]